MSNEITEIKVLAYGKQGALGAFDIKPALDKLDIEDAQEVVNATDTVWLDLIKQVVKEAKGLGVHVEEAEMLEFDRYWEPKNVLTTALIRYVTERIKRETKADCGRADDAMLAFEQAGGGTYRETYGKPYLSVNVKCYDYCSVPEFKEDETLNSQVDDWERSDFWECDINDTPENHDKYFGEYDFPKCYGLGRSGGHLCFRETEGLAAALQEGVDAVHEYEPSVDPNAWDVDVEELKVAYTDLAEWFESAVKWVEYVKGCMTGRIKNLQGKNRDWLDCHIDNERYELFDFSECTITIAGGKATVSWPQHERQFEDSGKWEECQEGDEGAREFTGTVSVEGIDRTTSYKKWIPTGPETFEFTVTIAQLIECLAPEIARATELLTSITKGK